MEELPEKVRATLDEQLGLLTTAQLTAAGVDVGAIASLRRRRALRSVRRGLYAAAGYPESREQELLGYCLHRTTRGVVSHLTAANRHGLWTSDEVWISVPRSSRLEIPGVTVHRACDLDLGRDVTFIGGVPYTTVARTLVDLGLVLPPNQVRRLLDHAIATGVVTPKAMWRERIRLGMQGRNGVGILGVALAQLPPDATVADSGPEVSVLRAIAAADLPAPTPQFAVEVGGRRFRIDLAYPDERIAIEYDGEAWHSTEAQQRNDHTRQRLIESVGWRFIRATKTDLASPWSFAYTVHRALASSRTAA